MSTFDPELVNAAFGQYSESQLVELIALLQELAQRKAATDNPECLLATAAS